MRRGIGYGVLVVASGRKTGLNVAAQKLATLCHHPRCLSWVIVGACVVLIAPTAHGESKPPLPATASGQPVPRYVSLKPSRANLRSGPGVEYPTVWVYRREGLPLEVIKEYDGWRQVRDADGASGWLLQSFLSGRRTALIEPWEVKPGVPPPQIPLYSDDDEKSRLVANVEAGVIANVISCDKKWCWVSLDQFKGYVQQKKLWGVYDQETLK